MSTNTPIITETAPDAFATFTTARIPTAKLRPGMLLIDCELGTAVAVLDHRIPGSIRGQVRWLIEDLEKGGWSETSFCGTVPVAVR